jgi:hypothetical protein
MDKLLLVDDEKVYFYSDLSRHLDQDSFEYHNLLQTSNIFEIIKALSAFLLYN